MKNRLRDILLIVFYGAALLLVLAVAVFSFWFRYAHPWLTETQLIIETLPVLIPVLFLAFVFWTAGKAIE